MALKDYPYIFGEELESKHMKWESFFKYIENYANHFDLLKHIVFNSIV